MLQVIFDVETKKTFDEVGGFFPDRLGISFIGACVREGFTGKGEMFSFFEDKIVDVRIFDSNYELMTTEDEDKENNRMVHKHIVS